MEDLNRRLRATNQDDHRENGEGSSENAPTDRIDRLESRISNLEDRLDEVAAATQSLRGYASEVQAVNDTVAQRADEAISAVAALEERFQTIADEDRHSAMSGSEHRSEGYGRSSGPADSGMTTTGEGIETHMPSTDTEPNRSDPPSRVTTELSARSRSDSTGVIDRFRDFL
ncbi:MAG: hypothetical protein ABEH64_01085 [Salinirussus sp.]